MAEESAKDGRLPMDEPKGSRPQPATWLPQCLLWLEPLLPQISCGPVPRLLDPFSAVWCVARTEWWSSGSVPAASVGHCGRRSTADRRLHERGIQKHGHSCTAWGRTMFRPSGNAFPRSISGRKRICGRIKDGAVKARSAAPRPAMHCQVVSHRSICRRARFCPGRVRSRGCRRIR